MAGLLGLDKARLLEPQRWALEAQQDALDLVVTAQSLGSKKLPREWPRKIKPWQIGQISASDLKVRITRSQDWFAVDGEVTVSGEKIPMSSCACW